MFKYKYKFDNGKLIEFEIDENGDSSFESDNVVIPDWVKLENKKCPICSIECNSRKSCPAALSILSVIEKFSAYYSYEEVEVTAVVDEVNMTANVPVQSAVRSMLGLLMALSSCPIMLKLRPMANYHMPFADRGNTLFRVIGMYLTGQYLRKETGLLPDWDLEGLIQLYEDIHVVNINMAARIRSVSEKDAPVNSLIILDAYAEAVNINTRTSFDKLKPMYSEYLKE